MHQRFELKILDVC